VAEDHAEKLPGMKRLAQVQEHIIACAESGKLETAVRARVGGDFTTLRTWYWNSERLSKRFDLCQMDPDNPFGIYSAGDLHWWIYVGRESLEAQLSALSGTTKQSASAETQCGKWLEQQFKQYETKRWSKGKFQSTAVEKFGTALGKRAFQRAWDRAVAKPGNESRKAAGAKRKLP
jgi:hypothetical protein